MHFYPNCVHAHVWEVSPNAPCTFLFFFLICVQAHALMINLYSCCIRPCPQYKVLPPLCSYSSSPITISSSRTGGPVGERCPWENYKKLWGDDLARMHPGTASYSLATTKDLVFVQSEKSRFKRWSAEGRGGEALRVSRLSATSEQSFAKQQEPINYPKSLRIWTLQNVVTGHDSIVGTFSPSFTDLFPLSIVLRWVH